MTSVAWKKVRLLFIGSVAFLVIIFFVIKNPLIIYTVQSKIDNFNSKYFANISTDKIEFKGLGTISFKNLLLNIFNDTICKIDTISVQVDPFLAIFGKIKVKELLLKNASIKFQKLDTLNTFQMLFRKKQSVQTDTVENNYISYRKRANIFFNIFFNLLPEKADIQNIELKYLKNNDLTLKIKIPFAEIKKSILKLPIFIIDKKNMQILNFASFINFEELNMQVKCVSHYKPNSYFPGFSDIKLKAHFDTANFSIFYNELNNSVVLNGIGEINNILVYQPSFSFTEVDFDKLKMQYRVLIKDCSIELDSSTYILVNKIKVRPYVSYSSCLEKKLKIRLNEPNIQAETFFISLPEGLFPNTRNIKATGSLSYRLNFEIDFNCIDSLKLESELLPKKFKILSFGS